MSQILHIFRKDVRRHWPEIAASLILVALFAWHEPANWGPQRGFGSETAFLLDLFWNFLPGFLFISWWLLIVRSVQDESLVGDRQFWVTRPYEWWKLLTSKTLFVFVFVNVPYFVADVILLHRAGFAILPHIAGLIEIQAIMTLGAFFTVATLAAVTSGIGQFLLAVLVVLLYVACVSSLSSSLPNSEMSVGGWFPGGVIFLFFLGTCLFVIFWQYARRRTMQSRLAIGAFFLAVLVVSVAAPYRLLVERTYPVPQNGQQPLARFTFENLPPQGSAPAWPRKKFVNLEIPLHVDGLASDLVAVRGIVVEIEAPGGSRADSRWQSEFSPLGLYTGTFNAVFSLDRKTFERAKSTPVKLRVSLALTSYKLQSQRTVRIASGEMSIPQVGTCSVVQTNDFAQCLAPLKRPSFLAQVQRDSLTCPVEGGNPPATAYALEGEWGNASGVDPGLDPISQFQISFSTQEPGSRDVDSWKLCPGTTITFRTPTPERSSRTVFEIDGVHLTDLLMKPPKLVVRER